MIVLSTHMGFLAALQKKIRFFALDPAAFPVHYTTRNETALGARKDCLSLVASSLKTRPCFRAPGFLLRLSVPPLGHMATDQGFLLADVSPARIP